MTTFNRTYRSPKFFLCVHHATDDYIGFEPAHERFSQFTFLSYGEGKFYAFDGEGVEQFKSNIPKTLFDVRKHLNYNVVGQSKANTKVIQLYQQSLPVVLPFLLLIYFSNHIFSIQQVNI